MCLSKEATGCYEIRDKVHVGDLSARRVLEESYSGVDGMKRLRVCSGVERKRLTVDGRYRRPERHVGGNITLRAGMPSHRRAGRPLGARVRLRPHDSIPRRCELCGGRCAWRSWYGTRPRCSRCGYRTANGICGRVAAIVHR